MLFRWLSAAVGIPLFLGVTLWSREAFAAGVLLLALLALAEMLAAYGEKDLRPNPLLAGAGVALPAWAWAFAARSGSSLDVGRVVLPAATLLLLLAFTWEVVVAARTGEMRAGRNVAYGLLCGVMLSLFAGMTWLRMDSAPVAAGLFPRIDSGAAWLLLTVFCVWATDSFALFAGKAFGKRKLAPKLSPGKTVEGALGGLAAALAFGALFGWMFVGSWKVGLAVGAVAGVFGQMGDLFESALKRELEIKDFGALLPGHGGVLDRFDSLLFVAPLVALLLPVLPR
jgi:phosphatidate cytidylyltransferase